MIIHHPEIVTREDKTVLWSRIELAKPREHFPQFLWYQIPNQFKEAFTLQSDAFLVPALLAGMHFKETIEVRGPVSPRLVYNLDEYQFLLHMRFPDYLNQVEIKYNQIKPLTLSPEGVGTTFSGGVDSLFTLWKHLPQNQSNPDYQVTHVIFIKGFDIVHAEKEEYWMMYDQYASRLNKIGIQLIPLETNSRSIRHMFLPESFFFGPTICGVGLAVSGLLKRFYVPSSWDYHHLKKVAYSTDAWVDRLTSTDTMNVIHFGATHRRIDKVAEIADWELAQEILWVCLEHKFEGTKWNCSRCEKCVRTMIPLYALGKLDQFITFAKPFKENRDGLWWMRKFSLKTDYVSETFPFVKLHKPDFLPWLRVAAIFGVIRYWLVTHLPDSIKRWFRQYGYFVTLNEAPDAYEDPEVTYLLRGMNDHPST